jgi:hypothetical protein
MASDICSNLVGMADKSPPEDPKLTDDEREANRRFQEAVGRLVNTPHQPHKAKVPPMTKAKPAKR